MMRCDRIRAEEFAQVMCHPLGHPARVDENQSSLVRLNQFREPTVDFLPNFVRHHRFQWRTRDLNREVQFATMADVDDLAIRIASAIHGAGADEETCNLFNRFLRCR